MSPRMLAVSKSTPVKVTIGGLIGVVLAILTGVGVAQKYRDSIIDEVRSQARLNDTKNVEQDMAIAHDAQKLAFVAETVAEIKADVREIKSILLNRKP